jgi:hypothetical protein
VNPARTQLSSLEDESAKPQPRVVDLDEGLTTATGDGPDASSASPGRTVQQLEVTTAPVAIAVASRAPPES